MFFTLLVLSISTTLQGSAKIIDGDTLYVDNEKVRLMCIDTPEDFKYRTKIFQKCLKKNINCGKLATDYLKSIVGDNIVKCNIYKKDIYGRYLGECFIDKMSINQALVEQGYAWYYNGGKECKNYKPLFEKAKKEGYGLFNEEIGGFKEPKLWRKTRSND